MSIAYGLENVRKNEGDVVTVCFICEHKQRWTDPQTRARLRELIEKSTNPRAFVSSIGGFTPNRITDFLC
jgi:hypothetical protein